jgi:hypothetical protein
VRVRWAGGPALGAGRRGRERIRWLQECQRDLERQAADVAEEIRRLQVAQQPSQLAGP